MPTLKILLTRRDALTLLGIVLLAFAYRMVILAERAAAPPEIGAIDPLPGGSDQRTYYHQALAFATGEFPPITFYYQPGIAYYLRGVMLLTGSESLITLRVVGIALAALNCGLMVAVAWLATGRRAVGYLAGGILAIYPIAAFYDTDLVITSQAVILATAQLLGAVWLWRRPGQWWGALLLGLAAGASAVTRIEVAILAPVFSLWLLAARRDRWAFLQISLATIVALLIVTPFMQHNRRGGRDSIGITPVPEILIYLGNNRDTAGTAAPSNASRTTSDDYLAYLRKDIRLDPRRFVDLQLFKTALFLSDHEPGNNLNYRLNGSQPSQALAWNPLNFPILLAAFLFGISQLIRKRNLALAILLLFASLTFFLVIMLEIVLSRYFQPIIIIFLPAAAYGLVSLWDAARDGRLRRLLLRSLPTLLGIVILSTVAVYGTKRLPRDPVVAELPAGAAAQHLLYDDTLELVGWQLRDEYSPRNVMAPFHPWVVSLYWRLREPVDIDYSFALKFLIDEAELLSVDYPLGYIVYPRIFTSEWKADQIYVEHVGLSVKQFDVPYEETGRIELRVYREREWYNLLPAIDETQQELSEVILARPAIRGDDGISAIAGEEADIRFGEELILRGWRVPATGAAGSEAEILTAWRTAEQQIYRSLTFSLHLFRGEEAIANLDSPPRAGALQTYSLPPNYLFDDNMILPLPDEAGDYVFRLCVYESITKERLIASEGEHNCVNLGEIHVTA